MLLRDWLDKQPHGAQKELALVAGVHPVTVWRIARGKGSPRFVTAKAISGATGGEVSVVELMAPVEKA